MGGWRMSYPMFVVLGMVMMASWFVSLGLADSASYAQILVLDRQPFYAPPSQKIKSGQGVLWYNRSMQPHTITHDQCGQRSGRCAFHSGPLHPGEQFTVRDLSPGTYPYHCAIHPFMRGVIIVQPSSSEKNNSMEL